LGACSSHAEPATTSTSTTVTRTTTVTTAATTPPTTTPTTTRRLAVTTAPWQLPQARDREIVLASGGALLVIGGLDPGGSSTGRVWRVDLASGVTTRLAVLPQVVHDSAGAVVGGDVFVFGGGAATELATVQRYRAGTATVVGQLPQPRSDLAAASEGRTAYVLGGFDGTNGLGDVLATGDGASFRTVARLQQSVRYPALAAGAGVLWLFGGTHDGATVASVQRVHPASGTAAIDGALPMPVSDASAVVLDGRLLVLGGRSAGRVLDTILEYDPVRKHATVVGTLPYPVADAGAAVVGGVAYLVGGENTGGKLASTVELRYR
jgi:hypothetical protein